MNLNLTKTAVLDCIKYYNDQNILIRKMDIIKEVSKKTKLGEMTVENNINSLLDVGLIIKKPSWANKNIKVYFLNENGDETK